MRKLNLYLVMCFLSTKFLSFVGGRGVGIFWVIEARGLGGDFGEGGRFRDLRERKAARVRGVCCGRSSAEAQMSDETVPFLNA